MLATEALAYLLRDRRAAGDETRGRALFSAVLERLRASPAPGERTRDSDAQEGLGGLQEEYRTALDAIATPLSGRELCDALGAAAELALRLSRAEARERGEGGLKGAVVVSPQGLDAVYFSLAALLADSELGGVAQPSGGAPEASRGALELVAACTLSSIPRDALDLLFVSEEGRSEDGAKHHSAPLSRRAEQQQGTSCSERCEPGKAAPLSSAELAEGSMLSKTEYALADPVGAFLPSPYAPEVVECLREAIEEDTDGTVTVKLSEGKGRGLYLRDWVMRSQIVLEDPPDVFVSCRSDGGASLLCACCGAPLSGVRTSVDATPESRKLDPDAPDAPGASQPQSAADRVSRQCSCPRCGERYCSVQCREMASKYQGHETLCWLRATPLYRLALACGASSLSAGNWGSSSASVLHFVHLFAALADRIGEELGQGGEALPSAEGEDSGNREAPSRGERTGFYSAEKYQAGGHTSHSTSIRVSDLWRVYPDILELTAGGEASLDWYEACGVSPGDARMKRAIVPAIILLSLSGLALPISTATVHLRPSVLLRALDGANNNGFSGVLEASELAGGEQCAAGGAISPGALVGEFSLSGYQSLANHSCLSKFQRVRLDTPLGGNVYALICTETANAEEEVCISYTGDYRGDDKDKLRRRMDILATHGIPRCRCEACEAMVSALGLSGSASAQR